MIRAMWGCVVAVALLGAGVARADEDHPVDVVGTLDANAFADLGAVRVGPIVFHQAFVQNVPPPHEVQGAEATSRCRPLPVLVLDSVGRSDAKLDVQVRLEDDAGVVLLKCNLSRYLKVGWKHAVENICRGTEVMSTADWPRVQVVHVVGVVSRGD